MLLSTSGLCMSNLSIFFLLACYLTALPEATPSGVAPTAESIGFPGGNDSLGVPDERFQVDMLGWGPPLKSTALLFDAVHAMANMAQGDFHEDIVDTTWALEDVPNMAITILPEGFEKGRSIQRRFAVWGLYLAVFDITKSKVFQCSTARLLWRGKMVGRLVFSKGVLQGPEPITISAEKDGSLTLGERVSAPVPPIAWTNSTTILSANAVFSINVVLRPTNMPINDIFVGVLGALSDLAAYNNKDSRVMSYSFKETPVPAYFSFTTFGLKPLSQRPYMTYWHIIETLAQLPTIMYERGKFSEADVALKVNGIDVGIGILTKMRPRPGLGTGSANLTSL